MKQTLDCTYPMNLPDAILAQHSKAHTQAIAQWIGDDPQRMLQLMDLLLHGEKQVAQRAAWIMSDVATLHPGQLTVHIPALVSKLKDTTAHIAAKRNIYRVLQFITLPEAVHGDLINSCFESVADPKEALAVRAFAMGILANMAAIYPDISHELKLIIEDALLQEAAPSFKSRAKRVLKQIGKRPG